MYFSSSSPAENAMVLRLRPFAGELETIGNWHSYKKEKVVSFKMKSLFNWRKDVEIILLLSSPFRGRRGLYHPNTHAKINGATIVASLSTINFGVVISSLPQVIFSLGTAPE